jgi:hypothetical protein
MDDVTRCNEKGGLHMPRNRLVQLPLQLMRRWPGPKVARWASATIAVFLFCGPSYGLTLTCRVGSSNVGPERTYILEIDDAAESVVAVSATTSRHMRIIRRIMTDARRALVLDNGRVEATLVLWPQTRLEIPLDGRLTQIDPCWSS